MQLPGHPSAVARSYGLRARLMVGHQIVYVLKSERDSKWYIGCTADLVKRLEEHNAGKVLSTKSRRPFVLLYAEEFSDKYEAFRIERFYKTAKGKRVLKHKINYCRVI